MSNNFIIGFKFKPVKKSSKPKSNRISKKTYCVCIEEEPGLFKAYVNIPSSLEFPDTLSIPFTENSNNLKGKTIIFGKKLDDKGKHICIIRSKFHATSFSNSSELYTPFRDKYVYSGYIVKDEGQYKFDVIDIIDTYANVNYLVPNIRLNNNQYNEHRINK